MNDLIERQTTTKRWLTDDFALTWPRCWQSPAGALEQLKLRYDDKYRYIAIVQEMHEDGVTPHLHGHIQFISKFNAGPRSFDLHGMDNMGMRQVYHPNIQKVSSTENWNKYMCKAQESGKIDNFTGQMAILKRSTYTGKVKQKKITNKELLEGDLVEMIDQDKINLYSLASILNARRLYNEIKEKPKKPLPEVLPLNWKDSTGIAVNMFLLDKKEKQRHFWIHSDMPNKGKTTFLQKLKEEYATSSYNLAEKYQKVDKNSDFLIFDEYGKGNCLKITDLNQICDGTYQFPIKGQESVTLKKPYVLIGSNFSIREVYPNSMGRIEARFNELTLNDKEFI